MRIFLSFHSDRSVFLPSETCAESTAIAGKIDKKPSLSFLEKVSKEDGPKRTELNLLALRGQFFKHDVSAQRVLRVPLGKQARKKKTDMHRGSVILIGPCRGGKSQN